jgi:sugar phosphate isomerase/epimerase
MGMKIPRERFFVLMTYDILWKNLDVLASQHINCSLYVSGHDVLDRYRREDIIVLKDFFDKNGLRVIVHGPFVDLNPGSLDRKIRHVSLERFVETLEIALLLNSACITIHSGFRKKPYKTKYYRDWLDNSIAMWKEFIEIAKRGKINVNIENAFEETPEPLIEIVEKVNAPNFKMCFDAGHYNAFSACSPLDAFAMIPPRQLGEIHLSDNDGSDDQHLPLGEGNIDIDALLSKIEALKINPLFTLEPRDMDSAIKDLSYLRNKGLLD